MKRLNICLLFILSITTVQARDHKLIDMDWQFSQDSVSWRTVNLPHDWSIEGNFNCDAPSNNDGAYLPTGTGYYTKIINIPEISDRNVYKLYFEGVYMNSDIKVNGIHVGGHPYGYSSFWCDITPVVRTGDNMIEVSVDNSHQRNCRWYTGSGIYRHVWFVTTDKMHFDPWRLQITTTEVNADSASVRIDYEFVNDLNETEEVVLKAEVIDPDGQSVAGSHTFSYLPEAKPVKNFAQLSVSMPKLWSIDDPNMYTLRLTASTLIGEPIDMLEQPFGIRTIEYSTDGFRLKGEPVLLNGACVHHDNGILGAASYDAAEYRKVKLLKEAGFNAVRTSHNVQSPAFYDACDRMGLLVIDEVFDGWRDAKTEHDYSELIDSCWQDDIAAMVLRDRNHPSIIAWSIGNEVIERKKLEVVTTAHKLASLCRTLDPTRPVTSALAAWDDDWEIYDPLAAELGVTGYNYMIHKAESDHVRVPERIMWQTESYPRDAYQNWVMASTHPYILGDFVWTGIDYLGESGIGRHYYTGQVEGEHWERQLWPWHGALCGDIDITGLRKPISHYRDFLYNRSEDIYMAVREPNGYRGEVRETLWGTYPTEESWTWPGWEGKPIEVEVISTSPTVSLYLNGKCIGEQPTIADNGWRAIFTLPYAPGRLTAQGSGKKTELRTAGKPKAIRLTADRSSYENDGNDVAFVIAEIVDANGTVVPDADCQLNFDVEGDCQLLGTGSADMTDTESYCNHIRNTHHGRAIAAVKIWADSRAATLRCKSDSGLKSKITLPIAR